MTTTTTQPVVMMAASRPHGVGYVVQPLAAIATYSLTAETGAQLTVRNDSSAPLLVTVDHAPGFSLDSGKVSVLDLAAGSHQLDLTATTTVAQSYVIDATQVTW